MDGVFMLLKILKQALESCNYVGKIITKKQTKESEKFDKFKTNLFI